MAEITPLLQSLRRIIARWTITEAALIADATAGSNTISVYTTQRFNVNDTVMIKDGGPISSSSINANVENNLTVTAVIDNTTIQLAAPLNFNWTVTANSYLVKTPFGRFVKTIFLGEPSIIPENALPAITVNGSTSHSEWFTTRMTKEHYTIDIGVFVEDSTDETSALFHWKLTDLIVQGLKKNIYPLVSDYQLFTLIEDIEPGDQYIKINDTSSFFSAGMVLIEDPYKMYENAVQYVVDANTLMLQTPTNAEYLATNTKIIQPNRFIFNSWPTDTKWGKIYKGTLLKSAAITYFAEEAEVQFNRPWSDTQLS